MPRSKLGSTEGKIAQAVIGDGDFFIREPGPVVHDRIFILQQLHDWARMEEQVASATAGVELAVETLLGSDRPDEAVDGASRDILKVMAMRLLRPREFEKVAVVFEQPPAT